MKEFSIIVEEYVGYMQGNAYIVSNGKCKFSLWESKEDTQKVCNYLNKLIEENKQLRKELNSFKPVMFQDMRKGTVILYSKGS